MSISKLTHILGNESKESIAILEKGGFALRNPLCFGWRSCRWWQGKMKAINFLEVNACFFFECFRFCSLSEAILNRIELCGPYCIAFWLYVGKDLPNNMASVTLPNSFYQKQQMWKHVLSQEWSNQNRKSSTSQQTSICEVSQALRCVWAVAMRQWTNWIYIIDAGNLYYRNRHFVMVRREVVPWK